jgi:hypothetical protein
MRALIPCAVIMTLSAAPMASAQTGDAPFCFKSPNGPARCIYGSAGACEQARPGMSADQCMTRSDANGVTGLGERTPPLREPLPLGWPDSVLRGSDRELRGSDRAQEGR